MAKQRDKSKAMEKSQEGAPPTNVKRLYEKGMKIYKNFPGHGWFQGRIVAFNYHYYRVLYEDGDIEDYDNRQVKSLIANAKNRPSKYSAGTRVEKFFVNHGWFKGVVKSFDGYFYRIRYDDGDEEDCEEHELDDLVKCANFLERPVFEIGTTVRKEFPGYGLCHGKVANNDGILYTVIYRNGDEEKYNFGELEKMIYKSDGDMEQRAAKRLKAEEST